MAKKTIEENDAAERRLSRKDVLIARKQAEQMRQIKTGVYIVLGLLAVLVIFAVVNELIIAPNRPVAIVGADEISLREWQDRVEFERAQRILLLENQLEAFQGDVGIVQQFGGQVIQELLQPEALGQNVLNNMIDELVVEQQAALRGISVTEAEIDAEIGASFNYFGGESPTPFPTATATVQPTPSVTPIPVGVITETLPTNTPAPSPTVGPTNTPRPTATPVTAEAYAQELNDFVSQFAEYGVSEADYRELVRRQLLREKVQEALAAERELAQEADHVSLYILQFSTEEAANEAAAKIDADGYLAVWNEIGSLAAAADPTQPATDTADELLWRTEDVVGNFFGTAVAEAAFSLAVGDVSEVIAIEADAATGAPASFSIIQVTGKELRPLTDAQIQQNAQQALNSFISQELAGNLTLTNNEAGRVPTSPVLDPKFTAPPTATPAAATP